MSKSWLLDSVVCIAIFQGRRIPDLLCTREPISLRSGKRTLRQYRAAEPWFTHRNNGKLTCGSETWLWHLP